MSQKIGPNHKVLMSRGYEKLAPITRLRSQGYDHKVAIMITGLRSRPQGYDQNHKVTITRLRSQSQGYDHKVTITITRLRCVVARYSSLGIKLAYS